MSTVEEIEKAIQALPPDDLAKLRSWFQQFDGDRWDAEFGQDVRSGRLDELADAALREHDRGETQPL